MKRILPIEKKPYFQTFSYHTYPNAVIMTTLPQDNLAARIWVKNFDNHVWSRKCEELTEQIQGERLELYSNEYGVNMNACYYREALEEDELEIVIEKQCFSNVWGAVNLFLTPQSQEDVFDDDAYLVRLGNWNKAGRYLRYQNRDILKNVWKMELPLMLRIRKQGQRISMSYRVNDKEEVLVHEQELGYDVKDQKFHIGIEVKLGNHSYYEWLYSNYIQIVGYVHSDIKKLDFYWLPGKDWNRYIRSLFLDYNLESQESIQNYGISYLEFVKKNLNFGRYIELWLNQYYVKGRPEYRKTDHFHQNLIYGYDDEEGEFYVMGFDRGKPVFQTISYHDFQNPRNFSEQYPLWILYILNPDSAGYELNIPYLVRMLQEYMDGVDSSQSTVQMVRQERTTYGMKVYDDFMSPEGILGIMKDQRASQLLYEHKRCMRDRVKYLVHRGMLPEWTEDQMKQMEDIYQTSQNLRNLTVKNRIAKVANARIQCAQHLAILKKLEQQLYPELIRQLKSLMIIQ